MKVIVISLGAVLALAACNLANDEELMENAIRDELANQGEVREVEITRQEDGNFSGHVVLVQEGRQGRLACTGSRDGDRLNYRCLPDIDDATLEQMQTQIRDHFTQQGVEVLGVDLDRVDRGRMDGTARVRANGEEIRLNCGATRENEESANFRWECQSGDEAADAGGTEAPAGSASPPNGGGGKPGADEAAAPADGGGKD